MGHPTQRNVQTRLWTGDSPKRGCGRLVARGLGFEAPRCARRASTSGGGEPAAARNQQPPPLVQSPVGRHPRGPERALTGAGGLETVAERPPRPAAAAGRPWRATHSSLRPSSKALSIATPRPATCAHRRGGLETVASATSSTSGGGEPAVARNQPPPLVQSPVGRDHRDPQRALTGRRGLETVAERPPRPAAAEAVSRRRRATERPPLVESPFGRHHLRRATCAHRREGSRRSLARPPRPAVAGARVSWPSWQRSSSRPSWPRAFLAAAFLAAAFFAGAFLAVAFFAGFFSAGSSPRAVLAASTERCSAARRSTTSPPVFVEVGVRRDLAALDLRLHDSSTAPA